MKHTTPDDLPSILRSIIQPEFCNWFHLLLLFYIFYFIKNINPSQSIHFFFSNWQGYCHGNIHYGVLRDWGRSLCLCVCYLNTRFQVNCLLLLSGSISWRLVHYDCLLNRVPIIDRTSSIRVLPRQPTCSLSSLGMHSPLVSGVFVCLFELMRRDEWPSGGSLSTTIQLWPTKRSTLHPSFRL